MVSMRAKLASRLSMNRVPHSILLPQCICLAVAVVALRQRRRVQRRNSSRGPLGLREAFAPLDTASQRDEFYHAKQLPPSGGERVRRTGEGDRPSVQSPNACAKAKEALHESSCPPRSRLTVGTMNLALMRRPPPWDVAAQPPLGASWNHHRFGVPRLRGWTTGAQRAA